MKKKRKIDSEKFKRFFFYGIENRRELKEGILYFSSNKVYKAHSHQDWYAILNQQLESEIIQEASKKYRQFYRFVTLNDESNNFRFDVDMQKIKGELEEEMRLLKQEGKVIETKAGTFFIRERENLLKGGPYYVYGEGLKGEASWTRQIYDILGELEEIEKEDKIEYQEYWLLTKLARSINRFDKEEALKVKSAYEKLSQSQKEKEEELSH